MSDITVRLLGDEDWQTYRDVRLAALKESPEAFSASAAEEQQYDEELWRRRMQRSTRLVAQDGDDVVGVVSVGGFEAEDADDRVAELFGLWVNPDLRGKGVAWKLVQAGAEQAKADDYGHLVYWVATDNGRAVAFASSFGFRPTDARRTMKHASPNAPDDEEMAMVYPLGDDPGAVPNSLQ
ncbi:GNAT family N-acetyltransferase [Calidifontibacter sp. DB0510]|uniref:GNAT family N-acetyltransferase n=1 Tax=Metallococcus carri TaxID=1656884 RepID=A0A967AZP6_9MICO|nr:GNAT family N-acetyltransferase [Metallococcus carri]NHN55329.1 GNAT family N-acetyltransferase [Metallococcus carri]NOP36406.1 GNAT family N-acetyltransferase [Calidifontibacter sp. DB2511S]